MQELLLKKVIQNLKKKTNIVLYRYSSLLELKKKKPRNENMRNIPLISLPIMLEVFNLLLYLPIFNTQILNFKTC